MYKEQKFFGSFFQKKNCFLCWSGGSSAPSVGFADTSPKRAMAVTQVRIDFPDAANTDSVLRARSGGIGVVQDDLGGFGGARLRSVGARLLEAMREQPTMCLHALAEDRNEAVAFGRFLEHDAVSQAEMLVAAGRRTGQRAAGRHVLAVQDTTELNFPEHAASKRGFGTSGNGTDIGLFIHRPSPWMPSMAA